MRLNESIMLKKILLVLLAMTMLLSCVALVSCKGDPAQTEGEGTTAEPSTGDGTTEGSGNEELGISDDVKFEGFFKVLGYNCNVSEFSDETWTEPDHVEMSLISRDAYVEERLGITFEYSSLNGQFADRNTFADTVKMSVQTNLKEWDLIGTYSMVAPNLAINGVTMNLADLNYLDFTKAWYPEFMADACTVNGQTYFITGDVSTNVLYSMQGIVFSATQAANNDISESELYEMVYNGEWTLENLFAMCEDLGKELDGDGVWDAGDFYPIVTASQTWFDSFYFATGLKIIDEDEDGNLSVSSDVLSEKVLAIYAYVYDAANTYHSFSTAGSPKALLEGKCIFSINQIVDFRTTFANSEEQFRILPFPKYEEGTSTTYRTLLSMGHTQYCIPNDVSNADRSAAVLETLGYASYSYVTPVIFEETMKLKYSENPDCSAMFDYLRNGCTYDVGSFYYMTFEANSYLVPHSMFREAVQKSISNWVSNYNNRFKTGLEDVVGQLNDFYSQK